MKRRRKVWIGLTIVLAIVFGFGIRYRQMAWSSKEAITDVSGELRVHFIDAGQSDCILVQSCGKNLLIDGGTNLTGGKVVEYLRAQGITYLDYVVGTHGHKDHVGGIDAVLYHFGVGELFLPRQQYDTHTYRDVLDAARVGNVPVTIPRFQEIRKLGTAKFMFVTMDAKEDYEDVNDSSLGIRVSNGAHSFLMCGDISKEMEYKMIRSRVYLKSDILKLSHHGSSDTNSKKFLKYVSPKYAVICCGKDNEYGHPHASVLKRLEKEKIKIFRTDRQGTIVFASDGKHLTCNVAWMK